MRNIQTIAQPAGAAAADDANNPLPTSGRLPGDPNQQPGIDDYKSKLIKLIPTEIVATYIFIDGIIKSSGINDGASTLIQWSVFGLLFFINPAYLYKVSGVNHRQQLLVSTIGFGVWVFALGGPFLTLLTTEERPIVYLLGSIVLALYTLIIPILIKPKQV